MGILQPQQYLLATAFLQAVDHLFKLQRGDFHLLPQPIHKQVIV